MSATRDSLRAQSGMGNAHTKTLADMDSWSVRRLDAHPRRVIFRGPGHPALKASLWKGQIDFELRRLLMALNNEKHATRIRTPITVTAPYKFKGRNNRGRHARFVVLSRPGRADTVLRFRGAPPPSLIYRLREVSEHEQDEEHRQEGESVSDGSPGRQGQGTFTGTLST